MNRCMRVAIVLLGLAVLATAVAGCVSYKSDSPLVNVSDTGYGPKPRADVGNLPRGPEHQLCRDELGRALDRTAALERDLSNCKRDRGEDKNKCEAEKKRLERERDAARDEAKDARKQLERLRGN